MFLDKDQVTLHLKRAWGPETYKGKSSCRICGGMRGLVALTRLSSSLLSASRKERAISLSELDTGKMEGDQCGARMEQPIGVEKLAACMRKKVKFTRGRCTVSVGP